MAALNVFVIVLWHYKLTVAFIKQEMKRGTVNIGIWPALRIPIKRRCHCGHIGSSCAKERALQLSVWWIRVNAVSSWTAQHAGVVMSSRSSLHSVSCLVLPQYRRLKKGFWLWLISALSALHVASCSLIWLVVGGDKYILGIKSNLMWKARQSVHKDYGLFILQCQLCDAGQNVSFINLNFVLQRPKDVIRPGVNTADGNSFQAANKHSCCKYFGVVL